MNVQGSSNLIPHVTRIVKVVRLFLLIIISSYATEENYIDHKIRTIFTYTVEINSKKYLVLNYQF